MCTDIFIYRYFALPRLVLEGSGRDLGEGRRESEAATRGLS